MKITHKLYAIKTRYENTNSTSENIVKITEREISLSLFPNARYGSIFSPQDIIVGRRDNAGYK